MIEIALTEKIIENEVGSNFYWKGKPPDYLRLINDLHPLGIKDDFIMEVNDLI